MPESVKCPSCRGVAAWDGNPFRPFCSERCKVKDLGAWASGDYRISGPPVEPDDDKEEPNDT